jgi:O-antigen/teichoic acid export membrane protein
VTPVSRNIAANVAGTAWSAALGLALVPVYLRCLGAEAYGLIGFFATLQAVTNLLDLGISPTLNREMARYAAEPQKTEMARDLVRTLEIGYWGLGALIGGAVAALAPLLSHRWIQATELAPSAVVRAVAMMGLGVALQWVLLNVLGQQRSRSNQSYGPRAGLSAHAGPSPVLVEAEVS